MKAAAAKAGARPGEERVAGEDSGTAKGRQARSPARRRAGGPAQGRRLRLAGELRLRGRTGARWGQRRSEGNEQTT